jgi:ankyrin repeat protein
MLTQDVFDNAVEEKIRYTDNTTPLHLAAMKGNMDTVQFLVSKGASVNARDMNGTTPLDYAGLYGRKEVVEYLSKRTKK